MFLENRKGSWHDWNIPYADGKVLYDLVLKNNYKKALEIGTSTGLSTIWIAWALSKTGGRLITIEIDEGRYKEALANFKEAGVSDYIDARLANAHELVVPSILSFQTPIKTGTKIILSPWLRNSKSAAALRHIMSETRAWKASVNLSIT